jgi:hypothetical protein
MTRNPVTLSPTGLLLTSPSDRPSSHKIIYGYIYHNYCVDQLFSGLQFYKLSLFPAARTIGLMLFALVLSVVLIVVGRTG